MAATLVHLNLVLCREDKPLFGPLTSREEQLVRQLARHLAVASATGLHRKFLQKHSLYLLALLFGKQEATEGIGAAGDVFEHDSFGLLVSLVGSLPSLFAASRPPRLLSGQSTVFPEKGKLKRIYMYVTYYMKCNI